ncbi:MAG: dynamin family protein [Firmicutes bacterium]|nr:dynamin family protein [Bacillota bacterium]
MPETQDRPSLEMVLQEMKVAASTSGSDELRRALAALIVRLAAKRFNLAVVGEFKRGKSTLINALLGEELLPSAVVPLTSVITSIRYGERRQARVIFLDGSTAEIPLAHLELYATEKHNPSNIRQVKQIDVLHPAPLLQEGVHIVDTPGIGSVYDHNTQVAESFLPQADAAILVFSVDQPVSQNEMDFLRRVREYAPKILFVLNKIDHLREAERLEALEFSQATIKKIIGKEVRLHALSARLALEGKKEGDPAKIKLSHFEEFTEELRTFLRLDREKARQAAVARAARRLALELDFALELQEKAILTPREELRRLEALLGERLEKGHQERDDIVELLLAETKPLLALLDEDLALFRERASGAVLARLADQLEKLDPPAGELRRLGEDLLRQAVEESFDRWLPGETDKINLALLRTLERFTLKADAVIQEVRQEAARLFGLSFGSLPPPEGLTEESQLTYLVGEPAVFLPTPDRFWLLRFLPRKAARRYWLTGIKERIWQEVDRNCGRVRYDFLERIKKKLGEAAQKLKAQIDGSFAELTRAVEEARVTQQSQEDVQKERLHALAQQRRQLAELSELLESMVD